MRLAGLSVGEKMEACTKFCPIVAPRNDRLIHGSADSVDRILGIVLRSPVAPMPNAAELPVKTHTGACGRVGSEIDWSFHTESRKPISSVFAADVRIPGGDASITYGSQMWRLNE